MHRPALVIVPIFALVTTTAITLAIYETRPTPPRVVAPAPAPISVSAPAPAPAPAPVVPFAHPIGGQFLDHFGRRFARNDGVPTLFLLSPAELASVRYNWQPPAIADNLLAELVEVLKAGCAAAPCSEAVEQSRRDLDALYDGDRTYGAVRTKHWQTDEDQRVDHRQIAVRSDGRQSIEATCTVASSTVGMRMWNDLVDCTLTFRDRERLVLTYRSRVRTRESKQSIAEPIDAFEQTVAFASREKLVVSTGKTGGGARWD